MLTRVIRYMYPQNNDVLYAPLISIYACLPQVLHARAGSYSEGLVVVLQFKATVWPKVASESTYKAQKCSGGASLVASRSAFPYCKATESWAGPDTKRRFMPSSSTPVFSNTPCSFVYFNVL